MRTATTAGRHSGDVDVHALNGEGLRLLPEPDARTVAAAFDLACLPESFYDDPYPTYHALRMFDPVRAMPDGSYFLSRHADLEMVYKDTTTFSSDKTVEFRPKFGDGYLYNHHTTSLVFNDPPLHTRVRKIIAGALTPRAVADMEGPVTRLVDNLLDAMADKAEPDLIEDFAAAIPVEVIGNLLDVPREERAPLRDWSLAILGALEPVLSEAQFAAGEDAVREFTSYLEDLIARRRAAPGDPDQDVLTRLIQGEANGDRLSENELLQNVIFILNAGHETTTNLIGNGLYALAEWPGERQRLLAEPELIKTAVEEFLRFESSNQLGNRITTQACEIGGVEMPAGTRITLGIGGANRDPEKFAAADRLDVARQPNRHLAFASGAHQCVGMNVARLEGRIAIGRFLARYPNFALAAPATRGGRARFRGFLAIPVRLD